MYSMSAQRSSMDELVSEVVGTWTASLNQVSPASFDDVRRDHPESWDRFQAPSAPASASPSSPALCL
jgi:hypothetical protein